MTFMAEPIATAPPETMIPTTRLRRVWKILSTPKAEWVKIAAEPMSVRSVMLGWVAPLAAIGPAAKLIGSQVLRYMGDGMHMPEPFTSALTEAVVGYALTLLAVYVMALIVNGLAVTFKGKREFVRALKLAAFGGTPVYLAAGFEIWPPLQLLEIAGLYSLYLILAGLPIMMHVPRKRALAYTAVAMLTGIALAILQALIVIETKDMFTPDIPASAWSYTPPGEKK
jgi:hypothetical protein